MPLFGAESTPQTPKPGRIQAHPSSPRPQHAVLYRVDRAFDRGIVSKRPFRALISHHRVSNHDFRPPSRSAAWRGRSAWKGEGRLASISRSTPGTAGWPCGAGGRPFERVTPWTHHGEPNPTGVPRLCRGGSQSLADPGVYAAGTRTRNGRMSDLTPPLCAWFASPASLNVGSCFQAVAKRKASGSAGGYLLSLGCRRSMEPPGEQVRGWRRQLP